MICVAGLEELTSGRISLGGRDITNLPPHQRDIAMVFQSALLYPHLDGARQHQDESSRLGCRSRRGGKQDRTRRENAGYHPAAWKEALGDVRGRAAGGGGGGGGGGRRAV